MKKVRSLKRGAGSCNISINKAYMVRKTARGGWDGGGGGGGHNILTNKKLQSQKNGGYVGVTY